MGKRLWTIELVAEFFRERDITLLEKDYKNTKTKMLCICSCGREASLSLESVKRGRRCLVCGVEKTKSKQRLSQSDVDLIFKENDCELLSPYTNYHTPVKFRCKCGSISQIKLAKFKHSKSCQNCGKQRSINAKKLDPDYIRQNIEQEGFKLLSKFEQCDTKMRLECPEGHTLMMDWDHFKQGYRCRECFFENNKGENHPLWNPHLTEYEREKLRRIDGIDEWRKDVFTRDKYSCIKCKSIGGKLNAHHIYSYDKHKELRIDVNNGVTLCETCHRSFHKAYGYGNNNEMQLIDFLDAN